MDENQKTSDELSNTGSQMGNSASTAKNAINAMNKTGTGASSASMGAVGASTAGSSSAAASGIAAGASAGSVGGPIGGVIGAAAGQLIKPFTEILFALLIMGLLTLCTFKSLPGLIFRDAEDLLSHQALVEQYEEIINPITTKYHNEILAEIRVKKLKDAIITATTLSAGHDSHSLHTNIVPTDEEMIRQLKVYANMIISMYEIRTADWWISPVWLADFLIWVDLLFVDFVTIETDIETTVTITETEDDPDTIKDESDTKSHIDIYITYTMKDKGIAHFQSIYELDEKQMEDSRYMADNLAELVGGMGALGELGGNEMIDGVITGGQAHQIIKDLLIEKTDDFFGGELGMPIKTYTSITSLYGFRDYPPDPYHTGIDFSAPKDTHILATMNGEVVHIGNSPNGYGKYVVLYHGGGITTMYAHMNRYGAYSVGTKIERGGVIGYVGATGLSTGNHLHYEYQIDGKPHNPNIYHSFF